ncbi:MAG: VWA domain-containing protein [Crocosphaera sp.]
MATEQELQFLKLPSENQGILSKVGNFLAGIIGSPATTNSGGTQTSTNNSLPGGGFPQISSSNPQSQPLLPPSQTNAAVNSQTSANLTPQNQGKNPQPTAQISTTVNNPNSQTSTNIVKPRSKTAMTLEEEVEFAKNPEPRCPLVLLLDVSKSMSGEKIKNLNEGIKTLKDELEKDGLAKLRVEVAIVSFGQEVKIVQDFVTVNKFEPPTLETNGLTPMGTAINKALDMVNERKNTYKKHNTGYYRPWVFMITDGKPQGEDDEVVEGASQRIKKMEDEGAVAFFAVGVDDVDMAELKRIVKRPPLKLKGIDFRELFQWLSASMQSVSHSKTDEKAKLPPPEWLEV